MSKAVNAKRIQRVPAKPAGGRARQRKHPQVLPSTLRPTKVSEQAIEQAVRAVAAQS